MNKKIIISCLAVVMLGGQAYGQSGIGELLLMVNDDSVFIEAEKSEAEARALAAKADNNLDDPELDYSFMPGVQNTSGKKHSYGISQNFGWPGEYIAKKKYAKLETEQAYTDYNAARQDFLLTIKLLCYEIVYYSKYAEVAKELMDNGEELYLSTLSMFDKGNATSLELNKAQINLASSKKEYNETVSRIKVSRDNLALLTGMTDINTVNFRYVEDPDEDIEAICSEAMEASSAVRSAQLEAMKSEKNVAAVRGNTLPSFSVGVGGERTSKEDNFFGVTAGMSIPLWGGTNKVKSAKREQRASSMKSAIAQIETSSQIREQATGIGQMKESLGNYSIESIREGRRLLQKNFSLGNMAITDYLNDIQFYLDAENDYLTLELELHKALAELLKYRL